MLSEYSQPVEPGSSCFSFPASLGECPPPLVIISSMDSYPFSHGSINGNTFFKLARIPMPEKSKSPQKYAGSFSSFPESHSSNGLAELRNNYGTGHGRASGATGLTARHAKLAAGAASQLWLSFLQRHITSAFLGNIQP